MNFIFFALSMIYLGNLTFTLQMGGRGKAVIMGGVRGVSGVQRGYTPRKQGKELT